MVRYDEKLIPWIKVNGKEYYLGNYPVNKDNGLQIGDSVSKTMQGLSLKHYKRSSQGFYLFKSYRLAQ